MDARFVATVSDAELTAALKCWSELVGRRIRPVLVTAFGDIFIELDEGPVLLVSTWDLTVLRVAGSRDELSALFDDPEWAAEQLVVNLVLLAAERGVTRDPEQVFSVNPHPQLGTGVVIVEHLMPMALPAWHHICVSLRGSVGPAD